jgi:HTH-type transcriptional regulator/antitoxin HigA
MASKTKFKLKAKDRDSYLELVQAFPLVSIVSDEHLEAASDTVDQLMAKDSLDHGEEMYLDALSDLIANYEDRHHDIEPASDAEMLRHLLESKGLTQSEVCSATGLPKSSLSEVLSGKKQFSRQMIRSLADYFQVDASVLTANF